MVIKLILFVHLLLSEDYEASKVYIRMIINISDEALTVKFKELLSAGN
jgi:hypothetical protein